MPASPSPRTESQPAAPRRVPVERHAPGGVYLEGRSLTPAQEERARELGYVPDTDGRWYRTEGD